jgi:single-strand DNA-binding protein
MKNLNSLMLEGNVVRDPVFKTTPNGHNLCNFTIATDRYYKKDDSFATETSFFEIEGWGTLAEIARKNITKGRGVRVVGRLKQNRWKGADGKSFSKITVVAEHIEYKPVFNSDKTVLDSKTATEYSDEEIDSQTADEITEREVEAVF